MSGKTIFSITLIAVATAFGIVFINEKSRAKSGGIVVTERVPTYGNAVNNPININKANPGNIRDSADRFEGEIDSPESDFKSFASMAYGFRAMIVILRTYYNKYHLKTLAEMISRWAPPSENDTENYINFVSQNSPFDPDADMYNVIYGGYNSDLKNILASMTWMEQGAGFVVEENDIRKAVTLLS